jgi:hypothetical protein
MAIKEELDAITKLIVVLKDCFGNARFIANIIVFACGFAIYDYYSKTIIIPRAIIKYQVENDFIDKNQVTGKRKLNFNELLFKLKELYNKKDYHGSAIEFQYHSKKPYKEHSWCLVVYDNFEYYSNKFSEDKKIDTAYFKERVSMQMDDGCKEFILKEGVCNDKFHLTPVSEIYRHCKFLYDQCFQQSLYKIKKQENAAIMCVGNKHDINDCYVIFDGDEISKYSPFQDGEKPTKKLLCDYISKN